MHRGPEVFYSSTNNLTASSLNQLVMSSISHICTGVAGRLRPRLIGRTSDGTLQNPGENVQEADRQGQTLKNTAILRT